MKAILFCAVLLLAATAMRSQVIPTPLVDETNLEQFTSRTGTVIQRELTRLGDVAGLRVDLVRASDLLEKSSMTGVRLSRFIPTGSREENTVFIDADEVGPLMRAIDVMKGTAFASSPDNFTDLVYRTRGGFTLGALYANRRWTGFIRLDRFDPRTALYLEESDFETLKTLLAKAREATK